MEYINFCVFWHGGANLKESLQQSYISQHVSLGSDMPIYVLLRAEQNLD